MALIVDIEKTLGDFHLKVNFTAEREVMALLGASGCGKSMTLGCIAGIVRPDKGHIELNGRVLFDSEKKIDLPPQKRKVGYLFFISWIWHASCTFRIINNSSTCICCHWH